MRQFITVSTFIIALLASANAHAILDCWSGYSGDTVCQVLSAGSKARPFDDASTCEAIVWFLQEHCPVIEDTGDGTDDDFLICEEVPSLAAEECGFE